MQTFVVRLAPVEDPDGDWHGIVQRIADGHEQPFHSANELLDLMRSGGAGRSAGTKERAAETSGRAAG